MRCSSSGRSTIHPLRETAVSGVQDDASHHADEMDYHLDDD